MNNGLLQKLLIIRSPGIGPAKYKNLLQEFGDVYSVVDSLHLTQSFIDSVYKEIETANNLGIQYIADDNDLYPKNLLKIKNHPIILSVRGNTDTLTKRCVAMVGTRHASAVGMRFISNLAEQFVKNNFVVVSGMAIGTDSAAHMGALNTVGNTQTIAVLAGGVDNIWPIENESLYYNILDRGIIVSEMPVGHKPLTQNFVQRNRWIAGLAEQLILGEADINSGSMTTAQFAINYNIPVFAVPGHPSDSRNMGPNMLIKQGKAKLCIGATDFFEEKKESQKKLKIKSELLEKINTVPVSESVLTKLVKKSITEIKQELVMLEIQGFIRKQDGGYVLN